MSEALAPRTGLDSPRAWSRSLSEEMARIARYRRPASLVLIEVERVDERIGGAYCHIGIGVEQRADVDRLSSLGRTEGRRVLGPLDYGPPVGYWAYISDPDGHNLEVSHGQEVGLTVERA